MDDRDRWTARRLCIVNGEKTYDEKLAAIGTTLHHVPLRRWTDELAKLEETAEVKALVAEFTRTAKKVVEPNAQDVLNSAKNYFVAKRIMAAENCQGISLNCLGLIGERKIPCPPCMAWLKLNDELTPGICECDWNAGIGQRLCQLLLGRPGFQQDPGPNTVNNTLIGAHCSGPTKLRGPDQPAVPMILRSHSESGMGVSPQVLWPEGEPITVMTFEGPKKILVGTGRVVANIDTPPCGRLPHLRGIHIDNVADSRDCKGFHQLFLLGRHERLFQAYAQLAGLESGRSPDVSDGPRTEIRQSHHRLIFALCSLAAGPAAQGHCRLHHRGQGRGPSRPGRAEGRKGAAGRHPAIQPACRLRDYNVYFLLTASTRSPHVPQKSPRTRRQFLEKCHRLTILASLACVSVVFARKADGQGRRYTADRNVSFDCPDPAVIQPRDPGPVYVFATGYGVPIYRSDDLYHWDRVESRVFAGDVPAPVGKGGRAGSRGIWAPDIRWFNGRYFLYYAVSTFGSQHSVIGLATNKSLDPASPDYRWEDQGLVLESREGKTDFNAIDPAMIVDHDDQPHLFWALILERHQSQPALIPRRESCRRG